MRDRDLFNLTPSQPDVWQPATDADKLGVLALLAGLPARAPADMIAAKVTYTLALDGTYHHALVKAAREIAQGALPHPYFPSPSEIRQVHDRIMQPWVELRERSAERRRRKWIDTDDWTPPTPESRARFGELYAAFCSQHEAGRDAQRKEAEEAERSRIRGEFGLTPEKIAMIPDRPLPTDMLPIGSAAPRSK